ncbi:MULTISPECIES: hypothetical protein [Asanoa]|uniref:Uncharacterized protein n=2 Tax=Asanoa TaxID=195964 RepID=A0A239PI39_9ACTN|nr:MULTISPECIES: hypothetical protein [Asanoa]GIF75679.1 hypothetical protein Asi02nite_51970 [Asanoa siamensis]SNT66288.1 hypothetical protein SAMN05421812_13635 [Asanoa hainanensis]
MPKSRGRKSKRPSTPAQRRRTAQGLYDPGKLAVHDSKLGMLLERAPGDVLPLVFPPMLWVKLAEGKHANVCVDACATLRHTYAQFGIDAQLMPVGLAVKDGAGRSTGYATTRPYWESGKVYVGHTVLVLPSLGRLVDPTVEQVPAIRKLGMGPLVGRVPAEVAKNVRMGSDIIGVPRGDLIVAYLPVDPDCSDVLDGAPVLVDNAEGHRRAGINLATLILEAFRAPGVVERIRRAPYPRLRALLDAIGDAPMAPDPAHDMRITLAGGAAVRLDELDLPAGPAPRSWLGRWR